MDMAIIGNRVRAGVLLTLSLVVLLMPVMYHATPAMAQETATVRVSNLGEEESSRNGVDSGQRGACGTRRPVTVVLPPTSDCDADGAVYTGDGRRLSSRLELTVFGPEGWTTVLDSVKGKVDQPCLSLLMRHH